MGTLPVKMAPRRLWCVTCVLALTLVLNTVEADANNLGHDTNEGLSNEIFDASRLTATTDRDANKEVSHEATSSDRGGHQAYKLVKSRTECGGRETSSNQVSVEACAAKCVSGFFAYGRKSGRCSGSKCKCLCEKVGTQCKQVSHAHYDLYRHAQATATTQAVAKKKDSKYQQSKGEFTFSPISTQSEGTKVLYVTDKDLRASNSQSTGTTLFPGPGVLPDGFEKNVQVSNNFSLSFWIKLHQTTDWQSLVKLGSGWSVEPSNGAVDADNWWVSLPRGSVGIDCGIAFGVNPFYVTKSLATSTACIPRGRWTYVALTVTSTEFDIRMNGIPFLSGLFPKKRVQSSGSKTLRIGGNHQSLQKSRRSAYDPSTTQKAMEIAHLTYYNSASYGSGGPEPLQAIPKGVGKYVTKNETGSCKFPSAAYLIQDQGDMSSNTRSTKAVCMNIAQESTNPYCFMKGEQTTCTKQRFEITHIDSIVYAIHIQKIVHCQLNVTDPMKKATLCDVVKQVGCYTSLRAHWSDSNNALDSCKDNSYRCVPTHRLPTFDKLELFANPAEKNFVACHDLYNATAYVAHHPSLQRKCRHGFMKYNYDCPLFGTVLQGTNIIKKMASATTRIATTA